MLQEQIDLLEIITNKQNSNPEINTLFKGLLYSPWQCSNKLIDKYVSKSLAKIVKRYKQSVLHFVFNTTKFNYYQTYICGIDLVLSDSKTGDKANFLAQLNLYKEVISEDLEKANLNFDDLSSQGQGTLVGLYIYATIAVYEVAGIIQPIDNSKHFHLKIKKCYLDAYLIKQFRTFCNQYSCISDYLTLYELTTNLGLSQLQKNSEPLKSITNHLVDKTLSINIKYLDTPLSYSFQQLFNRAQLLTFLTCFLVVHCSTPNKIELKPVKIHNVEILKAGFNQNEIDNLIADIDNRTGFYNTVLERTEVNDWLNLKNFNLYYMFNIHAKSLLDKALRAHQKWFEINYLIPYFRKELDQERFIIGQGFKRTNKYQNRIDNYDVDIVIYDKKTDLIYFCQLKHTVNFLTTSFRNELNTFNSEILEKGVNQLIALREIINDDLIKQQLITAFQNTPLTKSYIRKNDFSKNSRFILIHNMQDFDLCTKNSITLYEWNTLRNLLKGSCIFTKIDKDHYYRGEKIKELSIDLADLNAVKEHIHMNNYINSSFKISQEYLELSIYSHSQTVIFNKIIRNNIKLDCIAPYFN